MDTSKKTRKDPKDRKPIVDLEDLRDDTVAVVLNSGMTFKRVHEEGGPTPQTLAKWLYKETRFPRLDTVRAALKACDYDLFAFPQPVAMIDLPDTDGAELVIERLRPTTTLKLPKRVRVSRVPAKAQRASKRRTTSV